MHSSAHAFTSTRTHHHTISPAHTPTCTHTHSNTCFWIKNHSHTALKLSLSHSLTNWLNYTFTRTPLPTHFGPTLSLSSQLLPLFLHHTLHFSLSLLTHKKIQKAENKSLRFDPESELLCQNFPRRSLSHKKMKKSLLRSFFEISLQSTKFQILGLIDPPLTNAAISNPD